MISTTGTATERQPDSTDCSVAGIVVLTAICWFDSGWLAANVAIAACRGATSVPVIRPVSSRSSTTAVPCRSAGPSSSVDRAVNNASITVPAEK